MTPEVRRILFIRTDRIGDVLMNLPAIRLLRQTFPKAWLTALVDGSVAGLLKGHPDLDEVMAVDMARIRSNFSEKRRLIERVRAAAFEIAVVSNPDRFLHALVFLAGIPHRLGYARKWGFLLTKRLPPGGRDGSRHEIDLNLELASLASDRAWDGTIALPADPRAARDVEGLLAGLPAGKPVLAVHPGTSDPLKRWPEERFAAVCRSAAPEAAVVLVGGAEETEVSRRVAASAGVPLLDLTGRLSLAQLVAFFHHPSVRALVSVDSGPVHVAWISGTPVVALYPAEAAGSDPRRWGPRDPHSRVIRNPAAEISADEVWTAARQVLALGRSVAR